jgi:putative ABC transport system ATP-binding protein
MPETIVRIRNVSKRYARDGFEVVALDSVSLNIEQGDFVALMGPSGSGKSTLLNLIAGIDRSTDGEVEVLGTDLARLNESQLAVWRNRHVGYIFQTFNLVMVMSALENVALPMILRGESLEQAQEKAAAIADLVGLGHRIHHLPEQLSGGQRQRVAIARALANSPAVILADEPTGNLDRKTGEEIILLLKRLQQQQKVTVITATHDAKMISVSDRVVWIRDGKIERIADRDELQIQTGKMASKETTPKRGDVEA